MTSQHEPRADDSSSGFLDRTEELLVQCLGQPKELRDSTLDAICQRDPDRAIALRRQYAFLRDAGLLEASTPAAGSFPERVGDFRLLRRLGEGGMGVVYLAEQEKLDRRVALKLIRPELLHFDRSRERFRREALLASRLDHPGICPIFEVGEVDGIPFLAMRHVPGKSLEQHLDELRRASRAPDISAMVALVEKVARALEAAHGAGLVHRDVKPGNIQLGEDGEPVLLDFGLSRLLEGDEPALTVSGDVLGTPAYLAPEQIDARSPVGPATDVYGLGVVLYECLTLSLPFTAPNRQSLYQKILSSEPGRASAVNRAIPADLQVVLEVALDKDPKRRYASAGAFADDLARILRREPIAARRIPRWLRARRWCQRNPYAATALGVLTAGLVVALGLIGEVLSAKRNTESALKSQEAREMRDGNPEEALRVALVAVDYHRSPQSVAAVRAALHTPQLEEEIDLKGHAEQGLAMTAHGSTLAFAWCTETCQLGGWRDGKRWDGDKTNMIAFSVQFAPDGERIAIACNRDPARVFDPNGVVLHELDEDPEHDDPKNRCFAVAWHPGGKLLATGTGHTHKPEHAVHLWRVEAGKPPEWLWSKNVGAWPWHLRFTDDDHLLVAAGCARVEAQKAFRDHDVRLFALDGTMVGSHDEHDAPCMEMAISRSLVATVGHDKRLVLWDLEDHSTVVQEHPAKVFTIDFDPRGETLVTACEDGYVRFFNREGELLRQWAPLGAKPVQSAVFRPDGQAVLVHLGPRGRQLRTLDGQLLTRLPGNKASVRVDRFLHNDRLVAVDRGAIRIWRLEPLELKTHTWPRGRWPVLAPNGERYVLTDFEGFAQLREWGGTVIWPAQLPGRPITCVDNDGRAYAYTADREILVVEPDGQLVTSPDTFWQIRRMSCAPEGALVAVSAMAEHLRIVRREKDGSWRTPGNGARIHVSQGRPGRFVNMFHWYRGDNGAWRVLCGTTAGVVDYAFEDDVVTELGELVPDGDVPHLALDPSERLVAIDRGRDGILLMERAGTGWRKRQLIPFTVPVVHLAFATSNRLLVTSIEEVRIYDPDGGLCGILPRIDQHGFVSAHGLLGSNKVLTLSADYVAREWWLEDRKVMEEALERARR